MFTFLQSAAARLASHTSRSVLTPVKSAIFVERSYDPKFHGDLVRRLRVVESQDQTLLRDVRSLGRRVLGKAKKLLTKRTHTLSVSPSDESFCSPGNLDDDDEPEMPFNPIRRRPPVRKSQNIRADGPCGVECHCVADDEDSYYEEDRPVSMLSDNSDDVETEDSHQYQDLSAILEESEYSAILAVDEDGEVAEMGEGATTSVFETGDGTVGIEIQAGEDDDTPSNFERNNWTSPFPISPFFCSSTTDSTPAPSTPSESESGPSTPRYMPVLVYESASYEDALFMEFKAIIDWNEANENVV